MKQPLIPGVLRSGSMGLICSAIFISNIATNAEAFSRSPKHSYWVDNKQAFEGMVIDSHIDGSAIACLDMDDDATCDFGEPMAPVQGNGRFKIKTFETNADSANLIVTNKQTGKSKHGKARPTNQVMAAPAGHISIVSPLTTLVMARMLNTGEDAATADAATKGALDIACALDCDKTYNSDAATADAATTARNLLATTQAQIDGDQTPTAALKSLYAIDRELQHMMWADRTLAEVVVTTGDIYAVDLGDPNNPRNAAAYAGDVEVIAGTGYHNTVFDSADNKCQNCHNELYDTWKSSMHGQSWKDPIFQSKYQDFLRLQVSKIGAKNSNNGEYLPGMIQKTGQVCIKCHAPTAYYSKDYDLRLEKIGELTDPDNVGLYTTLKSQKEKNLAPAYDPNKIASVVSVDRKGNIYKLDYHIGNRHNREGINCSYCHSVETVRLMQDQVDVGDGGEYELVGAIKQGPIGSVVYPPGTTLHYNADADDPEMNAFNALIGPEKYKDYGNTPKDVADFDVNKAADGRHTIASKPLGEYTGGPFYGPFGITGLTNSRDDDGLDRSALVNQHFADAVEAEDGDKDTSEHHFAAYGKGFCLSCHQRSSFMRNPEYADPLASPADADDNLLELCTTWTAMSDGYGDNYTDSMYAPKCQRCHMEPIANKSANDAEPDPVLHKWNNPAELFTVADGVTKHFDPDSGVGPVAEEYMNNHSFMGANRAFGPGKIESGFDSGMSADKDGNNIVVDTWMLNKTAHMFPGAHPMRRVLTRIVVTDKNGNKLPYTAAIGESTYQTITNNLATLSGETILSGNETVDVAYAAGRTLKYQGQTSPLDGSAVSSQAFDTTKVIWTHTPDATVSQGNALPTSDDGGNSWYFTGKTTIKKIIDATTDEYFTRIYGRETGKRLDKTDASSAHVVRPGFDSIMVTDNRLEPNEHESYRVTFDASAAVFPVTIEYKVYYLKKGGNGKFPTDPSTGFYGPFNKKDAIYEVASHSETLN